MHPDRKIWPVVVLLVVAVGLTFYFAGRIRRPEIANDVDSISGYLAIACGVAAVVALGVAAVMLVVRRRE